MVIACPHGVIYGLKVILRGESVKDLVDLVLSMEHIPNVIYDKNYRIPKQLGNVSTLGWTIPHAGHAAEGTAENIKLSQSQTFDKQTYQWMEVPKTIPDGGSPHPATGSNVILCLTDTLHERNCATPIEMLCSTRLIKELSGKSQHKGNLMVQCRNVKIPLLPEWNVWLQANLCVITYNGNSITKRSMTGYKRTYGILWDILRKMT